jgi:methionine-rich copper-binding protein CopC
MAGPGQPQYVTSSPSDGQRESAAPSSISATFSQPLDASSTMRVFDQCGRRVEQGVAVQANQIQAHLAGEAKGHYEVIYTAVGPNGVTGATTGNFSFNVSSGPSCAGPSTPAAPNPTHEHARIGSTGRRYAHIPRAGSSAFRLGHTKARTAQAHVQGPARRAARHRHFSSTDPPQTLAAGPNGIDLRPNGTTVIVALSLCGVLGALGGWVLRVSSPS